MPIRTIPNSELKYHLISWDKKGQERTDDPDSSTGKLSDEVWKAIEQASAEGKPITDIYFTTHGWMGDVPGAVQQCDSWIGAMAACTDDREELLARRPDYRSLIIGVHWPSKPFGNESLSRTGRRGFAFAPGEDPAEELIEEAAESISDTPRAREALDTIVRTALEGTEPERMPLEVEDAYQALWEESGLSAEGPAGAPGSEGTRFDAQELYLAASDEMETGAEVEESGFRPSNLLFGPMRGLSYWKMKKRARTVGELGLGKFVREMQRRTSDSVGIHLMGHSFGCIVSSSLIGGENATEPLLRPINTVFLAQGAFSFWSYCSDIPVAPGKPGYFYPLVRDGKVSGPILSTQSESDTAVGKLYPLATGITRSVDFAPGDDYPRYGALGTFGFRGPGLDIVDLKMRALGESYEFEPGKIYNLESSHVISEGSFGAGSHGDIAKPTVGHAFWQAILAGLK